MTAGGPFAPIFVPDAMREAISDRAWLQAMLDVESALAAAEARVGAIPADAAEAIAGCCDAERFDAAELGRAGRAAGNPVVPLVRALTAEVPGSAARHVHRGATSQDVLDTAAMLVSRSALDLVVADLDAIAAACARLADAHRSTLMAGRTLLQHAVPVTFGLRAAGWLVAVTEARGRLLEIRASRLAVELGGAAGTLSALGDRGVAVLRHLAEGLGLAEPVVPWHTARARVAELGSGLAVVAGALGKLALDVALLSQTEVGELAEPSGGGRGASSTMPHKRNPVGSALAIACARRVQASAGVLLGAMAQEHERAAGAWHAEWGALGDALALTGGATASMREVLEGLEVNTDRMRGNLDATGGLPLAEAVVTAISESMGRAEAQRLVEAACDRALRSERPLREELLADEAISAELPPAEIDRALDPAGYLGSSDAFIDRALDLHRGESGAR